MDNMINGVGFELGAFWYRYKESTGEYTKQDYYDDDKVSVITKKEFDKAHKKWAKQEFRNMLEAYKGRVKDEVGFMSFPYEPTKEQIEKSKLLLEEIKKLQQKGKS